MTMLERAARAMWDKAQEDVPPRVRAKRTTWEAHDEAYREKWRGGVRAVLAAIREPDAAMLEAAEKSVQDARVGYAPEAPAIAWPSMLDAILAEKAP